MAAQKRAKDAVIAIPLLLSNFFMTVVDINRSRGVPIGKPNTPPK